MPCFSQELYQYGVKAEIFENNTVSYKITLIFANHPDQNFILSIGSPNNVNVESPTTDCKVQSGTLETNIICNMKASNRTTIIVNYDSNQKVDKKDNYFLFTDSFKVNADTDIIPILIKLPEGTGLRSPVENSYSPGNALIGSDGRRTIINWEMKNLKKGDRIDVSIAYERIGNVVISQIPIQVLLIIVFLVIVSFIVLYKFYFKQKNMEIILPILKKDEKKIFDTILKRGDGVNQKIIVTDSGYSKAKVSKVLKSLEERGVLKLERIGRKNKVHINKNFSNK
jgi:DNA-binding MarR family transcriptional regulator